MMRKKETIGDWNRGPPVTWSESIYYVIWRSSPKMRPSTEEELSQPLIPHCFCLHKDRVFMPLNLLWDYPKQGRTLSALERASVRAENSSCTTFRWIARCKEKKMAYSMPFLYGNHVSKAHLGRIAEDTPEHQGVVVYSMDDTPLVRWVISWEVVRVFTMIGLWCH